MYTNSASERPLAKALTDNGRKSGEVMVATKWWLMFRTASNILKAKNLRLEALTPFIL
jgi:aryl-alcohol dehydrogenase-like predicted oxidoreductase